MFHLVPVSMPPEMYDVEATRRDDGEGQIGYLKMFADDVSCILTLDDQLTTQVVLPPDTPQGWTLRSLTLDIIHIFEVNRKECAKILLELHRSFSRNTFKPIAKSSEADDSDANQSTLSLESLIVSTILSSLITLPSSTFDSIYYGSVITELCKMSPNTVAPPVGRAVRRIFSMLGAEGLDVEVSRRISDWFATHLSNFGFQWMWKEWYVTML
jgi:nuclear cap-binding protein subunit 1